MQVIAVAPHVGECARGSVGIRKGRNACGIEDFLSWGDADPSHPTCEQRFSRGLGIGLQTFSDFRRVRHSLRRQDHQQTVAVGIFRRDFYRFRITLGIGVAQNVNWIVVAPMPWQKLIQTPQALFGRCG